MTGYRDKITVIAGEANPALAAAISQERGIPLASASLRRFPDGEFDIKVEDDLRGTDCFVIQPTCPPVNENWIELLLLLDCLRRSSAGRITAVVPYFGYARKDRKDEGRVPISAKVVANTLVYSGADRVLALDLHAAQIQGFFDIPVDHLYAMPVLTSHFRKKQLKDTVIVAPDVGSAKMARGFAKRLDASLAIIDKRRPRANVSEVVNVVGDVEGRDCILADDMIDTAGTVTEAARALKALGANDVYVCATHAVFSGPAIERLKAAPFTEVVVTDTINLAPEKHFERLTVLSVGELLSKAVRYTHAEQSVSSLFD
jgi:ribose-phosphate pyrophosphokinase